MQSKSTFTGLKTRALSLLAGFKHGLVSAQEFLPHTVGHWLLRLPLLSGGLTQTPQVKKPALRTLVYAEPLAYQLLRRNRYIA